MCRLPALAAASVFLAAEHDAVAERFLKTCDRARVKVPFSALLWAELRANDPPAAIKHYETALKWVKVKPTAISLTDAKALLPLTQETPLYCPHCGKETSITLDDCGICGSRLVVRPLIIERYALEPALTTVAARVGLAEMQENSADRAAAYAQAQAALTALPNDHQAAPLLRSLASRLEMGTPPTPDQPAR